MFSSLVYNIEKKEATLRHYTDVKDYVINPNKPEKLETFPNIKAIYIRNKIKEVDIIDKDVEILGDVIKCWSTSDHILYCEVKEVET